MAVACPSPLADTRRLPEPLRWTSATLLATPGAPWALGGSAALVAFDLVRRPVADADLFTEHEITADLLAATVAAGTRRGGRVAVERPGPRDLRLVVDGPHGVVTVDLSRHPRAAPTVPTDLGPLRHPVDLAGDKVEALLRFAATKDAVDVRALARRWSRAQLVEMAVRKGWVRAEFVPLACQLVVERGRRDEVPHLDDDAWPELLAFYDDWRAELTGATNGVGPS